MVVLTECLLSLSSLLISIQSSSIWSSLLTIPTSIFVMSVFSPLTTSGLMVFIFIMVFVGGLMVLLTSVASAVYQEQAVAVETLLFIPGAFLLSLLMVVETARVPSFDQTVYFNWFWQSNTMLPGFVLFIVLAGLVLMSYLIMAFKGLVRSL